MQIYRNLAAIWDFHTPVSGMSMFEREISHSAPECKNRAPRTMGRVLSVSNHLEGSTSTKHHIVAYCGSIRCITHGKVTWKPGKLIKNCECETGQQFFLELWLLCNAADCGLCMPPTHSYEILLWFTLARYWSLLQTLSSVNGS